MFVLVYMLAFSVKDSCGGGVRLKRSDVGSLRLEM